MVRCDVSVVIIFLISLRPMVLATRGVTDGFPKPWVAGRFYPVTRHETMGAPRVFPPTQLSMVDIVVTTPPDFQL